MWKNQSVSVVFSTYNEKDSIRREIEDCFATGFVDEVVVVNNNAAPGTDEEVAKTQARIIQEPRQGYGYGYQAGLKAAKGDIVIMSEPDGTYDHKRDLIKLLIYSDDFPLVFGTRTTQALIHEGANMGFALKWGNVLVAKVIEVLFMTTELSDVGCTMRLIKKNALRKMTPMFQVGGNYFSPEMMMLAALFRIPFVEIPVHYQARIGQSRGAANFKKAFKIAFFMLTLIFSYRITSLFRLRKERLTQKTAK
ncbi:MAG TPA: glycosyltransferase [Candidatus Omnitrophota bacterium]|nr:glycosyltransferase [Candidatus Omnitrophota bacterium]